MNSQSRPARLSLLAIGSLALLIPLLILSAPAAAGKGKPTATPGPTQLPGDSPLPTPAALTPTLPLPENATAGESLDGGWKLLYNPPVVAPFSGAVSYNVAVELPPGRGGLLLPVNLSYNSRRVDGILAWVQDWVGVGWSVDLVDVVREGVRLCWPENTEWICYDNRFTLLMNGTGYELEPANGVTPGGAGRYTVRDAPQLYVELVDGAPAPDQGGNVTGLYWLVRAPNGDTYRLGYTTNSEQVLYRTPNCESWNNGGVCDAGRVNKYATYRWRVDQAQDVYGNRLVVAYREGHGGYSGYRDTASVPYTIRYNETDAGQWRSQVTFVASSFPPQPGDTPLFGDPGQLGSIVVQDGGQTPNRISHIANRLRLVSYKDKGGAICD